MLNKKKIYTRLKNLKYFSLYPLGTLDEKINDINPKKDFKLLKRLEDECRIIAKIQTASRYLLCKESYGVLDNPHGIMTRGEFLHKMERGEVDSQGYIGGLGIKMSKEEIDLFAEVALELYGKKQN